MTESKNIENVIQKNNLTSFMSDSKWEKLFENLIKEFDSVFIRYKLIESEKVREIEYDMVDFRPFFIEPIVYKELEWIEFPEKMLRIKNKRVSRQSIIERKQNVIEIEHVINEIGLFEFEKENDSLRLYGYK